jgi:F-type H+-transporting ATPase subunit delta
LASDQSQAIAQVYAEALFEIAQEREQAASVREELSQLAEMVRYGEPWRTFLETPAIRREEKAATIEKVYRGKVSDLAMDFLMVVARKHRLGLLCDMAEAFVALEDQAAGRVRGEIITAVELDAHEQVRLAEQVSRALRKTVALRSKVDPAILGGMVLTIEDTVMDGSVRRRLRQYAEYLRRGAERELDVSRVLAE